MNGGDGSATTNTTAEKKVGSVTTTNSRNIRRRRARRMQVATARSKLESATYKKERAGLVPRKDRVALLMKIATTCPG